MRRLCRDDVIKIVDEPKPVRALVQVHFPDRGASYTYYNDRFDLHVGDRVWVEGKLEKCMGVVEKVMYNFKIKVSEYKRVVSLIDTSVCGELYLGGSHLIAFDRYTLSREHIRLWFFPPCKEDEEEYVVGNDHSFSFCLEDPISLLVDIQTFERGCHYYNSDRVKYVCVEDGHGYAIVKGNECYEVEFEYCDGMISDLVCTCFCSDICKHEVAVMMQLRELLECIKKNYDLHGECDLPGEYTYMAAVLNSTFFNMVVNGKCDGILKIG